MGKLAGIPGRGTVGRFKGKVHFRFQKGNLPIFQKWPGPRRGPLKQNTLNQMAWFTNAVAMAKNCDPTEQSLAKDLVNGFGWYPHDALQRAMAGGLIIAYMKDGRVLFGRQDVGQNIQAQLDSITQTVGAMLFRGPNGWVGLIGAAAGDVLTFDGTTGFPTWEPPSAAPTDVLARFHTPTGNGADTTLDTLWSYTLPANTLANDGDGLTIDALWSFANNSHSKNAFLKFGADILGDIGGLTVAAANNVMISRHTLIRYSSTVEIEWSTHILGHQTIDAANSFATSTMCTGDLTTDIAILFQGQTNVATANDVTLQAALIRKF